MTDVPYPGGPGHEPHTQIYGAPIKSIAPITEAQGNRICTLLAKQVELSEKILAMLAKLAGQRFY